MFCLGWAWILLAQLTFLCRMPWISSVTIPIICVVFQIINENEHSDLSCRFVVVSIHISVPPNALLGGQGDSQPHSTGAQALHVGGLGQISGAVWFSEHSMQGVLELPRMAQSPKQTKITPNILLALSNMFCHHTEKYLCSLNDETQESVQFRGQQDSFWSLTHQGFFFPPSITFLFLLQL